MHVSVSILTGAKAPRARIYQGPPSASRCLNRLVSAKSRGVGGVLVSARGQMPPQQRLDPDKSCQADFEPPGVEGNRPVPPAAQAYRCHGEKDKQFPERILRK
ncbi:unnamed protein product [Pleuronectes platessa]|uniref:Uncharacterized protein n=1 Tax=Pleuronectes platessa TaxID=8262 RepID=A0A9N7VXT7_PLEPL|nr:unnamed protein product [Pleuronectes platessa]